MVYTRVNGEWVCPPQPPDDIEYYKQKGAPHCDDPVEGAEPAGYAPVLADNDGTQETPLKCYVLDEDRDISGNTLFINGEGKAEPLTQMLKMQNAVKNLNPETMGPGVQPGDIEAILSWLLTALLILIIVSTLIYYTFTLLYKQPHGTFWNFISKFSLKVPRPFYCPPPAQ
jgi:hypothetical protein